MRRHVEGTVRRVVVTGLGVLAPNGNGAADFELALRKGRSGLRANAAMAEHGFRCQVAGVPEGIDALAEAAFDEDELLAMNSSHRLAALAASVQTLPVTMVVQEAGELRRLIKSKLLR